MTEPILRELLIQQEKYYMTVNGASNEYVKAMRQLLEKVMSGAPIGRPDNEEG